MIGFGKIIRILLCDVPRGSDFQSYLALGVAARRVRYTVGRDTENSSARSVIE